jgi:hypothetical protein
MPDEEMRAIGPAADGNGKMTLSEILQVNREFVEDLLEPMPQDARAEWAEPMTGFPEARNHPLASCAPRLAEVLHTLNALDALDILVDVLVARFGKAEVRTRLERLADQMLVSGDAGRCG